MRIFSPLLLVLFLSGFGAACDKPKDKPPAVGGTCESTGGVPCQCPDGTTRCGDPLRPCPCDDAVTEPDPEPVGGDCESTGFEECECPDGSVHCSDSQLPCPCDSDSPAPPSSTVSFPTNHLDCDSTAAAAVSMWLETYFAWAEHTQTGQDPSKLVGLGARTPAATERELFLLSVGPKNSEFENRRIAGDEIATEHGEHVRRSQREAKILGASWTHPGIAIAFHVDTPWDRVVWATSELQKLEHGPVYLAFSSPRPDRLGMPSPELMNEIDAHYRLTNKVESPRHKAATGSCDDMNKLWGALEKMPPGMRNEALTQRLGKTWVDCSCKPDIEWLVGKQLVVAKDAVALVEVELGPGVAVTHPADAAWVSTHESLTSAEGPVQPAVASP